MVRFASFNRGYRGSQLADVRGLHHHPRRDGRVSIGRLALPGFFVYLSQRRPHLRDVNRLNEHSSQGGVGPSEHPQPKPLSQGINPGSQLRDVDGFDDRDPRLEGIIVKAGALWETVKAIPATVIEPLRRTELPATV